MPCEFVEWIGETNRFLAVLCGCGAELHFNEPLASGWTLTAQSIARKVRDTCVHTAPAEIYILLCADLLPHFESFNFMYVKYIPSSLESRVYEAALYKGTLIHAKLEVNICSKQIIKSLVHSLMLDARQVSPPLAQEFAC